MASMPPHALAQLEFTSQPDIPALGTVTLAGASQAKTAQMPPWEVDDSRIVALGWQVTAQGDSSPGRSAVFREYCSDGAATNGCDTAVAGGPGPGYVSSGATLAEGALTIDSSGASFAAQGGPPGAPPLHLCSTGCALDTTSGATVASAVPGTGLGTWRAEGYSIDSLSLAIPSTVRFIGTGNKLYRVDLLWTLASGP